MCYLLHILYIFLCGVGVYWLAVACKAFLAWLRLRLDYLHDLHRYGGFTGILRRYTGIVLRLYACAVTYTRAGGGAGMHRGAQHAGVLPRTIPILCLGQTPVIRRGRGGGAIRGMGWIYCVIYREVYWAICWIISRLVLVAVGVVRKVAKFF